MGGYGSSMAFHAADSTFWILTDRGPNVDGPESDSKVFLLPAFTPRVGIFKLRGDSLYLQRILLLKDHGGRAFSGLPPEQGDGRTGETAYDRNMHKMTCTANRGIDPEGLALAPDGTFWVSDEYGPYLLHFDRNGQCLDELSPFNGGLPVSYAQRRPNRGMEGVCISPEGGVLYGIMQSPLQVADSSLFATCLPLMALRLDDGSVRQYAYPLDHAGNGVSELAYQGRDTLLVLERDGDFPKDGKGCKRIYRVLLSEADASKPLRKTLAVDLLADVPSYDHDKPEGMALIGDSILAVVNDDDFGVSSLPDGTPVSKLKRNGRRDHNQIYFIRIKK